MHHSNIMFGVHGVIMRAAGPSASVTIKQEDSRASDDDDEDQISLNVQISMPLSSLTQSSSQQEDAGEQEEDKPDIKHLIKKEEVDEDQPVDQKDEKLHSFHDPIDQQSPIDDKTGLMSPKRLPSEIGSDVDTDVCDTDIEPDVVNDHNNDNSYKRMVCDESSDTDSDLDITVIEDNLKPADVSLMLTRCQNLLQRPIHETDSEDCGKRWPIGTDLVEKRVNRMRVFTDPKLNDRVKQLLLLPHSVKYLTAAAETLALVFWAKKDFATHYLPHMVTSRPEIRMEGNFERMPLRHYKLFFAVFKHILRAYTWISFERNPVKDQIVEHFDHFNEWPVFRPKTKSAQAKRKPQAILSSPVKEPKRKKVTKKSPEKVTSKKRKESPVKPKKRVRKVVESSSESSDESEDEDSDDESESDSQNTDDSDRDSFIVESDVDSDEEESESEEESEDDEDEEFVCDLRKRCAKLLKKKLPVDKKRTRISWPRVYNLKASVKQISLLQDERANKLLKQVLLTKKSLSSLSGCVDNLTRVFWSPKQVRRLNLPAPTDASEWANSRSMLPHADLFYRIFMQIQGKFRTLSDFSSSQWARDVQKSYAQSSK